MPEKSTLFLLKTEEKIEVFVLHIDAFLRKKNLTIRRSTVTYGTRPTEEAATLTSRYLAISSYFDENILIYLESSVRTPPPPTPNHLVRFLRDWNSTGYVILILSMDLGAES